MRINYSDYIIIPDNEIIKCEKSGITYNNNNDEMVYINFKECAVNFRNEYPEASENCIGERWTDKDGHSIVFYTAPLTTHIFFKQINKKKELFFKSGVHHRFYEFQKKINDMGWKTYDMS